jgi:radical S-adenosyl methionine domain-containing protein 2
MLITNGKLLHKTDLSAFDWVGLSIDSFSQETCNSIGRDGELDYFKLSDLIRANKCRLKVNTVVSKLNMHEDFTSNIIHLAPERWKVMQVLEIKGQNDLNFERYAIDSDEFGDFVSRHRSITQLCSESNEAMRSSYLIVDHSGALLDNSSGEYRKSDSILDIGVERALEQIRFDYDKFIGRDALYDWR